MRPALVIKPNPVTDYSIGMLQSLKPFTMNTLLFQSSDYALDHPVLLRTVGRDELLLQAVASEQGCEASAGKDQAIVRAKQEGLPHSAQGSKPGNQGLLQGRFSRPGFARTRQMPAQEPSGVAVDHQCQGHPAISTCPDAAKIGRPALIRRDRHRRKCFYSRPIADRALLHLPTRDLEDPLNGVLVHVQKAGHGSVAIRRGPAQSMP
ncbi:hypothetical protein MCEMIE11_00275 [Burkholderiales bacterium]